MAQKSGTQAPDPAPHAGKEPRGRGLLGGLFGLKSRETSKPSSPQPAPAPAPPATPPALAATTPKPAEPAPAKAPKAEAKPKAAPQNAVNKPAPKAKTAELPLSEGAYTAKDIEVLEGLEPVRRRPGMYIGGIDERALHHLFAEVLDNSMDEAVAGFADRIEVEYMADGTLSVADNGRGIPIDPHPKFPKKSALEVILTTLHAGGKFSDKVYHTSGGLHGVGVSVVNALSDRLEVEVARDRLLYGQSYSRGAPQGPLKQIGTAHNRRGTTVRFHPDSEIFGPNVAFKPSRLFQLARSKAYLHRGVEIRWKCAPERLKEGDTTPAEAVFHFPNGLKDFLTDLIKEKKAVLPEPFFGKTEKENGHGRCEWAVAWITDGFGEADGFLRSYCNTIPTPDGGFHEQGMRAALSKGLKAYAELIGDRKASLISPEDVMGTGAAIVSVFIRDPQFEGQTKGRLVSTEAAKIVEQAVRDPFDHWLAARPNDSKRLLDWVIQQAEERIKKRKEKEVSRQNATRRLRLPGKLADCSRGNANGTEIFIVEGDSAGGSAKQARDRETQAILPLRGKILNVASAGGDKLASNAELADLTLALGCGTGAKFRTEDLRYERVIIMTDADVDGAHIASLLITFFHRQTPGLIRSGRLFLAMPPLYRLTSGKTSIYARDEAHKAQLEATTFKGKKPDVSRFKGLGEMMPADLKQTTMNPLTRTLARVVLDEDEMPDFEALVETLMGRKPELRFNYIQKNAKFVEEVDV
ncbi:MAG: DNA topoisomerase IV subunit B [Hyphomonadaceae bacterium]|nr:DNA topoisomerase IV subunit B [Hyphomonadaceae bacterium]